MRILITMLTLLFVCGCSSEKASNQKGPLTIAKSDNVEKTIKTDNRLAGIDLNDVYQGFISYVKDVQEKYRNGELKQLEASPPANGDIFAERFSWIKPDDLKWYFTLRPVELLWASTVIMVVAQEIDMNDKSQDYTKWGIVMEKEGADWVPQSVPRIAYIYSFLRTGPSGLLRRSFTNTEIIFSPEDNYDPRSDESKWNYTWPHELLPSSFNNAEIISTPIEPNSNNKGMTKGNYGKPVIIRTSNNIEIELICTKYHKPVSGYGKLVYGGDYKQINIDGKKAWISHYNYENKKFTMIKFFVGDVLYQIKQNGEYNENACIDIIKQITTFMKK